MSVREDGESWSATTRSADLASEIRSLSLAILARLAVTEAELEVSLDEIDCCVDLALLSTLQPIDRSASQGGFGPPELWVSTVVPAVRRALELRSRQLPADELEREVLREVGAIAKAVGAKITPEEFEQLIGALVAEVWPREGFGS